MGLAWVPLWSAIGVEIAATASLPGTDSFRDPLWTGRTRRTETGTCRGSKLGLLRGTRS
jgi:hypothetical protein